MDGLSYHSLEGKYIVYGRAYRVNPITVVKSIHRTQRIQTNRLYRACGCKAEFTFKLRLVRIDASTPVTLVPWLNRIQFGTH
jgi:hypothetical protein